MYLETEALGGNSHRRKRIKRDIDLASIDEKWDIIHSSFLNETVSDFMNRLIELLYYNYNYCTITIPIVLLYYNYNYFI